MIDAVIKIGGSVLKQNSIKKLGKTLDNLIKDFSFVIIPGGGDYANLVRRDYTDYQLSEDTVHWMAILGENILGFLLLEYSIFGVPVFTIDEIHKALDDFRIPVLMPFRYLFEHDPLEHSWEITSDSIASYFASVLKVNQLILLKDVDGIYSHDPKDPSKDQPEFISNLSLNNTDFSNLQSCIDVSLPVLLKKYRQTCYIINGLYPDRLYKLLHHEQTIYTKIEL